jgi:hypothetical protein
LNPACLTSACTGRSIHADAKLILLAACEAQAVGQFHFNYGNKEPNTYNFFESEKSQIFVSKELVISSFINFIKEHLVLRFIKSCNILVHCSHYYNPNVTQIIFVKELFINLFKACLVSKKESV